LEGLILHGKADFIEGHDDGDDKNVTANIKRNLMPQIPHSLNALKAFQFHFFASV